MIPYPEVYLSEVSETQGRLFLRVAEDYPNKDTSDFIVSYLSSDTRRYIDEGQAYLTTMDDGELLAYFLAHENYKFKEGETMKGFKPDWIGRFYSHYQWKYGLSSRESLEKVPLPFLEKAYGGLHDLDIDLAVEKVGDGKTRNN